MLPSSRKVFDVTQGSSQALLREDEIKPEREPRVGRECDAEHIPSELLLDPAPSQEIILVASEKAKISLRHTRTHTKKGKRSPRSRIAVFETSLTYHFIFHIAASCWEFWHSFCCQKGFILSSEMRPLRPCVWSAPPTAAEYWLLSLPQMWRRICCDSPQSWRRQVTSGFDG